MSITFGRYNVTNQVFLLTPKSYGIVNLRPLLPGHVLICPRRYVRRFSQLEPDEVTDLFQAVQLVSKAVENYYKADAINFAIQDGPLAGQSIDHVHCHIIPRTLRDLPDVDYIYQLLNKNDIDGAYRAMWEKNAEGIHGVDFDSRSNRTQEEMAKEAETLKKYMQENFS